MKLAEALMERKALKTRMADLESRITDNATVQEGSEPTEDPAVLFEEWRKVVDEYIALVERINRTNRKHNVMELMTERDLAKKVAGMIAYFAKSATPRANSLYSRSEIKTISAMNVPFLRDQADAWAKKARQLDAKLQALDWEVDLED